MTALRALSNARRPVSVISQDGRVVSEDFVQSSTLIEQARRAAAALVDREEATTRSRMLAYERVAQLTGANPSWLRKFVSGYAEAKQPSFMVGHNLLAIYARMQKPRE